MTLPPTTAADDMLLSRKNEIQNYTSIKSFYTKVLSENAHIYEAAFELTDGFTNITAEAILSDSRIIKILRFAIAPSISQMKLGQFVGRRTVKPFEDNKLTRGDLYSSLKEVAKNICDYVKPRLDPDRFVWISDPNMKTNETISYAKKWTCSLAAEQNAETIYRTWRKNKQEDSARKYIETLGYIKSDVKGLIKNVSDINLGEYTTEIKVEGRTKQKADIVCRSKKTRKLILIEAKAVGVELDATKRIKECCDKANDWSLNSKLLDPTIVALIAGFFTKDNISNLQSSKIKVVWEHDLAKLAAIL